MSKARKAPRPAAKADQATIENWIKSLTQRLADQDYAAVLAASGPILRHPATRAEQRADVLAFVGIAHMMLGQFDAAYRALTEALRFDPEDAYIWFNRGLVARLTTRSGQSLRDLERAIELEGEGDDAERFRGELALSQELVDGGLARRGEGFTLDQLIAQEELYQRAIDLCEARQWRRGEEVLRQVIAMGDGLPQPWGNLGVCLMNLHRFDEAEVSLKRALEIEPAYELAQRNLDAMAQVRERNLPVKTLPISGR